VIGLRARWIAAWTLLGAGYALMLAGLLTIGVVLVPFVAVGTWLLVRSPQRARAWPAALVGVALLALWIALENAHGPGTVCSHSAGGDACTQESSPWPWLAVALTLAVAGVTTLVWRARRSRRELRPPDPADRDPGVGERGPLDDPAPVDERA
jgi:hypothetical protein